MNKNYLSFFITKNIQKNTTFLESNVLSDLLVLQERAHTLYPDRPNVELTCIYVLTRSITRMAKILTFLCQILSKKIIQKFDLKFKIGQKRSFFEKGPGRLNYVIVVVLKIEFRQHVQQDKGYLLNILF